LNFVSISVTIKIIYIIVRLKPTENCVDVPKEVCVRVRNNPRTIKKPIVKKWCYVPTDESGLTSSTPTSRSGKINRGESSENEDFNDETTTTVPAIADF
jgi:hypothetical protein